MADSLVYLPSSPDVDLCVRTRQGQYDRPTILFIHGLGDSSSCWKPFFDDPRLADLTLLAPDLPGYGRTRVRRGESGGIAVHLLHLREVIRELVGGPLLVTGHSYGGLIATFLVRQLEDAEPEAGGEKVHEPLRVLGLVNIEGNVTGADAFISGRAVRADQRGHFDEWYEAFLRTTHEGLWAEANPHLRHYADSLRLANPLTFLRDCQEMAALKSRTDDASRENEAGGEYLRIRVPKIYVFGTESIPGITLDFLKRNGLVTHAIENAGHWAMLDAPGRFVSLLLDLLERWDAAAS